MLLFKYANTNIIIYTTYTNFVNEIKIYYILQLIFIIIHKLMS